MEINIKNQINLSDEFIWKNNAGLITKYLGSAAGSQKLYVNIDKVPSQAFSTKYHSHSQQEEFFLILEGQGILRLNDNEYSIKKGDFIAKPAGRNIAHTFYNSSDEILEILDVGTVEKEDTCYYPDEEIFLVKSNGDANVFKKDSNITEWKSDPNNQDI
ncbi:MAG: cupin domain-containing protein [Anaerocolumna sp.]